MTDVCATCIHFTPSPMRGFGVCALMPPCAWYRISGAFQCRLKPARWEAA